MRCKGTTKKGKRCRKTVLIDSNYCAQHESQAPPPPPIVYCARCGPEKKETVYKVQIDSNPDQETPLCVSCMLAFQRLMLEFLGVDEIDKKLLEFRENSL